MFQKIDPKEMDGNAFTRIGDQWLLITAGSAQQLNTMTASWGGLGVLWGKPVATIYIRPQRYTYEFAEREDYFTLSFLDAQYRPQLALCGAKSGREVDKVKECNFTVETGQGGAPYFAQAELVLVCKKLYRQDLDPACFLSEDIQRHYPEKDYHRMYIGEIVEVLKQS